MTKKFPIHPLIFGLYPLLFLLNQNIDTLRPAEVLRAGGLWLLGAAVLYGLAWLVLRSAQRAALLTSLWLLMAFAYDPAYELVRGASLLGVVVGKHRFLAPVWLGLAAAGSFWIVVKLKTKTFGKPASTLDFASLALFIPLAASVFISGASVPPLRLIGLLPPPHLEVTYIDVGNMGPDHPGVVGEAILLRSSDGQLALIDGGYPNRLAAAYLAEHGVTHLDLVVLTHPHDDHAGGLIEVLNTIPVDLYVSNGQPLDSPVYSELEETLRRTGVQTREVRSGDEIAFGGIALQVLSPNVLNPNNINNGSIVIRLVNGAVTFLFTGDMDHLEESRLIDLGVEVHADILKVAHHGADSSSSKAFIAKVNADVAIYSSGAGNMHKIPHAVTIETLRAAGMQIYGTDVNGTIVVKTDGKTYQVIPERGGPR